MKHADEPTHKSFSLSYWRERETSGKGLLSYPSSTLDQSPSWEAFQRLAFH
jgi:hypothetical protein